MEKGVPIRSISRAVAVLQAINRSGSLSLMDIAHAARLPYPTACRIVQTLLHEGLIEREPARKHYRATALVHTLSHGFQNDDRLVVAARPHIVELTRRTGWPISVCTHVGSNMIVRDSTHALTSLTFNNYYPGYALPILGCAAGLAYLGFAPEAERKVILESLRAGQGKPQSLEILPLFESGFLVAEITTQGYATSGRNRYTENPGKTSSIAVPLRNGGKVVGAISLIFFSSAMRMAAAVNAYVEDLAQTAQRIGAALDEVEAGPPARQHAA